MVPKAGFEPARVLPHWFLRPARLPFRHFGRPRLILGNRDKSGQARVLVYGTGLKENYAPKKVIVSYVNCFPA